jgi:hypothetical protein
LQHNAGTKKLKEREASPYKLMSLAPEREAVNRAVAADADASMLLIITQQSLKECQSYQEPANYDEHSYTQGTVPGGCILHNPRSLPGACSQNA